MSESYKMVGESLRLYIQNEILPRYHSFDKAHDTGHATQVIDESISLAAHYPDLNLNMVYAIAAYHDLGLCEGRELHHIVSGRICRADTMLRRWFSEEEIDVMCDAIEDHRASSDHSPRTLYGMIVAEADRVISPDVTLRRTVQYGLANHPELDMKGQYERFCAHLQQKYAEGGYIKLWIPYSQNATRLAELRSLMADKERLRSCFERIFREEKR